MHLDRQTYAHLAQDATLEQRGAVYSKSITNQSSQSCQCDHSSFLPCFKAVQFTHLCLCYQNTSFCILTLDVWFICQEGSVAGDWPRTSLLITSDISMVRCVCLWFCKARCSHSPFPLGAIKGSAVVPHGHSKPFQSEAALFILQIHFSCVA